MATQRQEIAVRTPFVFNPVSLNEAKEFAVYIASSGLCPQSVRGKPADVFIILQTGAELGLKPMQALRTLGVINGMPFAYGDGQLALARKHPDFEDIKEWIEGEYEDETLIAFCELKRKGQSPVVRQYTVADAKRAGLWNKTNQSGAASTWKLHGKRMLQHRARTYAIKDAFPDALYGLPSELDMQMINEPVFIQEAKKPGKGMQGLEATLGIVDAEIVEVKEENPKLVELVSLLDKHEVKQASIDIALEKFAVPNLESLTETQLDTWINHLKKKENQHAV